MDDLKDWQVSAVVVDDPDGNRHERLTGLLAVGVERLLRQGRAVDSRGDVSVYPDVEPGQPAW